MPLGEPGAVGGRDGDVVLDAQRVVDLAAEALGRDAGADALARRVHGRCRAGRAAADDEHVVGRLGVELLRVTRRGAGVELGDDLLQRHAARGEGLAVQPHGRHGHDLAALDLALEQAAVDDGGLDARVQHGHQRQRLDHVRAVVTAQAHIDLEVEVGVQRLDRVDRRRLDLGRVAAGPQQREHEGRELVAKRDGGKAQALRAAGAAQQEAGLARIVAVRPQRDLVAHLGDLTEQFAHLGGGRRAVQRRDDVEGERDALHIGLELGLEGGVQHGDFLSGWRGGAGHC